MNPALSPPLREVNLAMPLPRILSILDEAYPDHPMGDLTAGQPYLVLVACILSLRTKDEVSIPASQRLFKLAQTPKAMVQLDAETIASTIYPTGFYKTKAVTIIEASQALLDRFDGQVPNTIEALLTLKGVGRKTANLVVGLGHRLPAICVDTHVHRICNRLGYLQTSTPDATEFALRDHLPVPFWQVINRVMVRHGQDCCKPIGPRCDVCPVIADCAQVGVKPRTPPKPSAFVAAQKSKSAGRPRRV
jgi:endonuclease-3